MHAQKQQPRQSAHERLSGIRLRGALMAGAGRVLAKRDDLNRINVFPVPDGDTGTNLAFTMQAVLKGTRRAKGTDVGAVLKGVAREAIDGARGNSGAILAQFFQGLAEHLERAREVSASDLADAAGRAARMARACLAEPREGTMLSVIADFAAELRKQVEGGLHDLNEVFRRSLTRARASLANTPNQLPVLKAAGVVDAGAAGFVDFLEGVQDFIDRGRGAIRAQPIALGHEGCDEHVHLEAVDCASGYRYCTECVLTGQGLDLAQVRARLHLVPLDSLVVAGGSERVRVHAHVDAPSQLFEALAPLGEVGQRKADDMHAQARLRAAPFQRVRVVTDSAGDLPAELAEALGITVVPVRINFGDEEYFDRVTMTPLEMYRRLRQHPQPPRTSQPPPGDFRRAYELVLPHCERIVSIELSSKVSGTWQAACTAARESGEARIHVIDTLNASTGLALVTVRAAEVAASGADHETVVKAARQAMTDTRTIALIRDLKYGVHGGRISPTVKKIADALGLTVLVGNRKGYIKPVSALWGRHDLPRRFARAVARRTRAGERYRAIVGHADAAADAAEVVAELQRCIAQLSQVWVVEAGPAIGAHAGPGSLVVGLQRIAP